MKQHLWLIIVLCTLTVPLQSIAQESYIDAVTGAARQNAATKDQESTLPSMVEENPSQQFQIVADSIILEPGNSIVCLKGSLRLPWMNHALYFSASHLPLKGIGVNEPYRLSFQYSQAIIWSNTLAIIPGVQESGYIEMDCKGIKTVAFKGEVEFCRSVLIPELPDGSPAPEPYRAHGKFTILASSLDDMMAEVSISRVQLPALPDFSIQANKVFLDLSDTHNPPGLGSIAGVPEEMQANWQGVWIDQANLLFPPGFSEGNKRMEVGIRNFTLDRQGVSGKVYSAISKSLTISDWQLRMDTIQIEIKRDRLRAGKFSGLIAMPLQKSTELRYQARIEEYGNITLILQPEKPLALSFGKGQLILDKISHLRMQKFGREYGLIASLSGQLSILDIDQRGLQLPTLLFKDLRLSTHKPFITINQFGTGNAQAKFGPFELFLHKLNVSAQEIIELNIDASLSLMEASAGGFSTRGDIKLILEKKAGKWTIKETKVEKLFLKVVNPVYRLEGEIHYYKNDAKWGDGFGGKIQMEIKPEIKIKAEARFGNFENKPYWVVNAFSKLPAAIPFMGPLGLSGIGGGIAYRMRCSNPNAQQNREYSIDLTKGLYIQAQIETITIPIEQTFNANLQFDILFNKNGSIAKSNLFGIGKIMADPDKREPPLSASVLISYDIVASTIHGNFAFRVDFLRIIEGIHANKLAGEIVFHIDPNKWYLHAGRPSSRLGIRMPILQKAEISAYLMVGHDLEPIPPPPAQIMKLIGKDLSLGRDDAALSNGVGFAFGATLDINTGKQTFLLFYGSFHAIAGFDLLIRNYGPTAHCSGKSETIGIDGWFVKGQAYAYAQGEIGMAVDAFGIKGEFQILEISAALCLQATLPNPSFIRGNVGGQYSILNGLIEGNCDFQVQFGTECYVEQEVALNSLAIIRDISPADNLENVSTLENPSIFFDYPIETSFRAEDINGKARLFKVAIAKIVLNGPESEIQYDTLLSADKKQLTLITKKAFTGESDYFISITVKLLEWTNNTWNPCKIQNHPILDAESSSFKTAKAINKLDSSMIIHQYPLRNHQYFHTEERAENFILLEKENSEVLENCILRIIYIANQDTISVPAQYKAGSITWNQPPIKTNQPYTCILIHNRLNTIYQFSIRTSQFKTFKERSERWPITNAYNMPYRLNPTKRDIRVTFTNIEWLTAQEWNAKLVSIELGKNQWWNNRLYPWLYKTIETEKINHPEFNKEKALLDIEPIFKTIQLKINTFNKTLEDYHRTQAIIAERIASGMAASPSAMQILLTPLPVMGAGTYPIHLKYHFPDKKLGSSSVTSFKLN